MSLVSTGWLNLESSQDIGVPGGGKEFEEALGHPLLNHLADGGGVVHGKHRSGKRIFKGPSTEARNKARSWDKKICRYRNERRMARSPKAGLASDAIFSAADFFSPPHLPFRRIPPPSLAQGGRASETHVISNNAPQRNSLTCINH
jgi:hypothetical protein